MARRKTPSVDFATRFLLCLACRQGLGREFVPYLNLLCALARVDWVYDCDKYVQIYQEEPAFPMQDSFGRGIICYVFKKNCTLVSEALLCFLGSSPPFRASAFWRRGTGWSENGQLGRYVNEV